MTTHSHHAPQKWERPYYGTKTQWAPNKRKNPILPHEDRKLIQKLVQNIIYYARSTNPTILVELGKLATDQSKRTEYIKEVVPQLPYDCVANVDAKFIYHARNMTLCIHRHASDLSEIHARTRAGGHIS